MFPRKWYWPVFEPATCPIVSRLAAERELASTASTTQPLSEAEIRALVERGMYKPDFRLVAAGSERNHSQFVVFKTVINPYQRSIPIGRSCQSQRNAMRNTVRLVFRRIKLNSHFLL